MKNCHDDKTINSMIGIKIRVELKNWETVEGILAVPTFGNGYLIKTRTYDYRFYKSHVKRIELLQG